MDETIFGYTVRSNTLNPNDVKRLEGVYKKMDITTQNKYKKVFCDLCKIYDENKIKDDGFCKYVNTYCGIWK